MFKVGGAPRCRCALNARLLGYVQMQLQRPSHSTPPKPPYYQLDTHLPAGARKEALAVNTCVPLVARKVCRTPLWPAFMQALLKASLTARA